MQFPHSSFRPLIYSIGIPTFSDVVETPPDQIACEMWGRWCRCCPWAPQPGPVGQAARLSETPVAFAGTGRASTETGIAFAGADRALSETGIAFAGAGRASTETGIAFAGEKWVFLAHFSVALVLSVSMVAVQGRAVVMVVSMSPRCCASWAKKFALRAQNGPKLACCGVLGEFFRGPAVVGSHGASCGAPRPW